MMTLSYTTIWLIGTSIFVFSHGQRASRSLINGNSIRLEDTRDRPAVAEIRKTRDQ